MLFKKLFCEQVGKFIGFQSKNQQCSLIRSLALAISPDDMTAYLSSGMFASTYKLSISDKQFDEVVKARETLASAFALEESYDLLVGNYVEVEQEVLAATVNNSVRNLYGDDDFFELRSTINRRVINLLTATRLYIDQTPQWLKKCAAQPKVACAEFETRKHFHYDNIFSYRFLEALRNHVQHCGLAVHSVTHGRKWHELQDSHELELSLTPLAEKSHLCMDSKFKKKILDEMPEKVVLMHAIREYLECIGDIHTMCRGHVVEHVKASRQTFESLLSAYAVQDVPNFGIVAFRTDPCGREESVPLLLNWDDIRIKLVAQNSGMVVLSRKSITGRTK